MSLTNRKEPNTSTFPTPPTPPPQRLWCYFFAVGWVGWISMMLWGGVSAETPPPNENPPITCSQMSTTFHVLINFEHIRHICRSLLNSLQYKLHFCGPTLAAGNTSKPDVFCWFLWDFIYVSPPEMSMLTKTSPYLSNKERYAKIFGDLFCLFGHEVSVKRSPMSIAQWWWMLRCIYNRVITYPISLNRVSLEVFAWHVASFLCYVISWNQSKILWNQ